MTEAEIREKVDLYSRFPHQGKLNVWTNTTEFMRIQAGDVINLEEHYFLVRGEEVEGRFGLDGEPKFWVKKVTDLSDGSPKILKLVFYESFLMQIGPVSIRCFRSPRKEARILRKTKDDPYFMKGFDVQDPAGNTVRILERIQGARYYDFIQKFEMDHETYYHEHFPGIFKRLLDCFEAMLRLHRMEEVHGDIRNDHILIDRKTNRFTWIDFDYTYEWAENPFGVDLYGLGNILLFTVGMGFHNLPDMKACAPPGMKVNTCVEPSDLSLFFKHRVINLQKLFPYIPDSLNNVLMHFSCGTDVFYESTEEILKDLKLCEVQQPS